MKLFLISLIFLSALIPSCNSSKTNSDALKNPNNISNSLPHGSVVIAATISEFKEKAGKDFCIVMVDTVLGYGGGIQPIGTKSELELNIDDFPQKSLLKKDTRHRLTLRHFFDKTNSKNNKWILTKID